MGGHPFGPHCLVFFKLAHNAPLAAAVRVYLFYVCFSSIACRFGECQPTKTARIARLQAC